MAEILQGTTPGIELTFATTDFLVSEVVACEFAIKNMDHLSLHGLDEVTLDAEANSITYHFTQAETLALDPRDSLRYQCRVKLAEDRVIGTEEAVIAVKRLMSKEVL